MFSAGILPYDGDYIFVGLQAEGWTTFSGKSKIAETPVNTAIREFCEETAGLFSVLDVKEVISDVKPIVMSTPRGYCFYLYCVNIKRDTEHASRFETLRNSQTRPESLEMREVEWIKIDELEHKRLRNAFRSDYLKIRTHLKTIE